MRLRRAKRRVRVGIVTPKEKRARREYRRKNKVRIRKASRDYYRKNKGRIRQRQRMNKNRKITGPKRKTGVKYKMVF